VRYLIGDERGEPVYRICEVVDLGVNLVKPYKINEKTIDKNFELRYVDTTRLFPMDKTSNGPFTQVCWLLCTFSDQMTEFANRKSSSGW